MILGIIQAKMESTDLPGKPLKEINGKPLLWYLHERVAFSKLIDKIVISCPDNEANKPLVRFAEENGIDHYSGSELDIIERTYKAADKFEGDIIVRVTDDNPLIDHKILDKVITFYLENKDDYDFVSNAIQPTYPDGLAVDVMPFSTIAKLKKKVKDPFFREWFVSFLIESSKKYRIANVANDSDLSYLRVAVHYEEDFDLAVKIFNELYEGKRDFTIEDILTLFDAKPALSNMNFEHNQSKDFYKEKRDQMTDPGKFDMENLGRE